MDVIVFIHVFIRMTSWVLEQIPEISSWWYHKVERVDEKVFLCLWHTSVWNTDQFWLQSWNTPIHMLSAFRDHVSVFISKEYKWPNSPKLARGTARPGDGVSCMAYHYNVCRLCHMSSWNNDQGKDEEMSCNVVHVIQVWYKCWTLTSLGIM